MDIHESDPCGIPSSQEASPTAPLVFSSAAVDAALGAETWDEMVGTTESRVLVLYTGGTIGMQNTRQHGYIPAAGFLTATLASMRRFHAPEGPVGTAHVNVPLEYTQPTLQQRSPEGPRNNPGSDDGVECVSGTRVRAAQVPELVTPPSLYGKRIRYAVWEYDPLLDSANMTMADWIKIATDIEVNYALFDAFIILHGTDTMAYTASALSFMLEDLGKTVIITGSQVPLSEVRNDAVDNLLGTLTVAGHFIVPEVGLYFDNKLFRGNRSTKIDAVNFNAFDSPNLRPLVSVNINIDVSWEDVLRPTALARFRAHKTMNANVATLRLFPGITESTVRAFLQPPIQGVVLETYGAGNGPNNRREILDALEEASVERGVVLVNCTQCRRGLVSTSYATGRALANSGVVPGADMTPECALAKLSYLLGKRCSPAECRRLMAENLRGELSVAAGRQRFTYQQYAQSLVQLVAAALGQPAAEEGNVLGSPTRTGAPRFQEHEMRALERLVVPVLASQASRAGDAASVAALAAQYPAQVLLCDQSGRTPLHVAASEGHYSVVRVLLRHGASLHARDRLGRTPLHDAVDAGHPAVVGLLRGAGAHFGEEEAPGIAEELCGNVAVRGNAASVRCYIAAGADFSRAAGPDRRSFFHALVLADRPVLIYQLLSGLLATVGSPVGDANVQRVRAGSSASSNGESAAPSFSLQVVLDRVGVPRDSDLARVLLRHADHPCDAACLPQPLAHIVAVLSFNQSHVDVFNRTPLEMALLLSRSACVQALHHARELLTLLEALSAGV